MNLRQEPACIDRRSGSRNHRPMTTTSTVADRARSLIERKDLEFLPGAASLSSSSSDGFLAALVEGAFLVAVSDGRLSGDEMRTLATTMNKVTGDNVFELAFASFLEAAGDVQAF